MTKTTTNTAAVDLWEDAGPFLYRNLPEEGIDAFFTEERDMITIERSMDKWWIGETGTMGQQPYGSLDEAKSAADARIADAERTLDGRMLAEAGLDPTRWRVRYDDGIAFDEIDGERWMQADTDAHDGTHSWMAYRGDEIVADRLDSLPKAKAALGLA